MAEEDIEANPRRIAFCVAEWGHPTTVLTWAWLRQYFLRKQRDEIYIVHTGKRDNWAAAGPSIPELKTCLESWNHKVVSLHGSLQSNMRSFLEKYDISLVVLGEDFPRQGGFRVVSASEWVKSHVTRPFIIIRQDAVASDQLRIATDPLSPTRRLHRDTTLSPESAPRRRIGIAYPASDVGMKMIEAAKKLVLLPKDEIFLIHCDESNRKVVKHTKNFIRTISLGLPVPGSSPTKGTDLSAFLQSGAELLSKYDAHMDVALKGDPRNAISSFCEEEGIDLLVISSRSAGKIRKTLSGGSVSGYLIDKLKCPCLVLPLKSLGYMEEGDELGRSMTMVYDDGDIEGEEGELPASVREMIREKDEKIAALQAELEKLKAQLNTQSN